MRFDLEALWQFVATTLSWSPAKLIAAGGVALATLVVVYGALLGLEEDPSEEVVVAAGPVFTPVNAPAPVPAMRSGNEAAPAPAFSGSDFDDPSSITSKVQRGLKRAGCYGGPVNGVWSRATSRAMAAFTSRVNASLPVDRPDPVLLALLDTHRNETCSGEPAPNDAPYAREAPAEANVPPASSATSPTETAALGESDAYIGTPEGAAAVAAAAAASSAKSAHDERPAKKRRTRKQNSFARSVSKGLKQIQRSLNKLF
ncbi:MAG: peptidoglycan-binding domain-containing protein [Hyphomicrobium sp.]|uniref:peptidoglycan-binding domain-containing protein n=1 Tax=Hyphomicrobium sp. TaxID=82 RepID=UPI003D0D67B6